LRFFELAGKRGNLATSNHVAWRQAVVLRSHAVYHPLPA
jgi:hypothetical protein